MTLKLDKPDAHTLELTLEGIVDRADYARFVPEFDAACESGGKVSLLIDVSRLGGWTLGALWEDVKFDLRHFDDVDRVAVVGDPPPAHWLAALAKPFTTAEVAHFEAEDIDAARVWVRQETPGQAPLQPDDRQVEEEPMQVSELMTRPATFCSPEATCAEIAQLMRDHDIGALPVAENERLIGMVTDRDIVLRAVAEGVGAKERLARDVMTDEMLYCFSDADPAEVLENMGEVKVRRLPVVDRDKNLVGLVSIGDLAGSVKDAKVGRTEAKITATAAA